MNICEAKNHIIYFQSLPIQLLYVCMDNLKNIKSMKNGLSSGLSDDVSILLRYLSSRVIEILDGILNLW